MLTSLKKKSKSSRKTTTTATRAVLLELKDYIANSRPMDAASLLEEVNRRNPDLVARVRLALASPSRYYYVGNRPRRRLTTYVERDVEELRRLLFLDSYSGGQAGVKAQDLYAYRRDALPDALPVVPAVNRQLRPPELRTAVRLIPADFIGATPSKIASIIASNKPLMDRARELSQRVFVTAVLRSASGMSLFDLARTAAASADADRPSKVQVERARASLVAAGLQIERVGEFSILASGPAKRVAEVVGKRLRLDFNLPRSTTRKPIPTKLQLFAKPERGFVVRAAAFCKEIDHFAMRPTILPCHAMHSPPSVAFPHLGSAELRALLNVPNQAGNQAWDGSGIKVAVIDNGVHVSHPAFVHRGHKITPLRLPWAPDPDIDDDGHGTAMAWNILTIAPAAEIITVGAGAEWMDAIEESIVQGADLVVCSWGVTEDLWPADRPRFPDVDRRLKDLFEKRQKLVVFASGNLGQRVWPGDSPHALSVGGVYFDPTTKVLSASDYASGYVSARYAPPRTVPNVSGPCANKPRAVYWPTPCKPASTQDVAFAAPYPDGDGVAPDDGWFFSSGTSGAASLVGGVVALILQKAKSQGRHIGCREIITILESSCVPVRLGVNGMNVRADIEPRKAVGHGLVDASAALSLV